MAMHPRAHGTAVGCLVLTMLVLTMLTAACSSARRPPASMDAGRPPDSSTTPDAGPTPDTGVFRDGSPNVDAAVSCPTGFDDCDGIASNGCEADLSRVTSCGGCANACTEPDNGSATCSAGSCGITCNAGFMPAGSACVDIDECAAGTDGCPASQPCVNLEGSFRCRMEQVFGYTGSAQTFTVPAGVTSIMVTALGAQGGCTMGGRGGEAIATIAVTPGETLEVYVGGQGGCGSVGMIAGGFNGGGDKYTESGDFWLGASGGGASDVRRGSALTDRLIVAGGGGGSGYDDASLGGDGGGNAGLAGDPTDGGCPDTRCSGDGGNSTTGGTGGYCNDMCIGLPGELGLGGRGTGCAASGGGGGGGYYGGGGGAHCSGGGGSSRADFPSNTGTSTRAGVRSGNGQITIAF